MAALLQGLQDFHEHRNTEHRNITEHSGTPKKPGTPPRKPGTPQKKRKNRKSAKSKRIKNKNKKMKRTRSNMKIRATDRNNLKDPRHGAFKHNTISLPFFGFFNETTLSWQIKNIFSTTSNVKYYRKTEPILNHGLIPR